MGTPPKTRQASSPEGIRGEATVARWSQADLRSVPHTPRPILGGRRSRVLSNPPYTAFLGLSSGGSEITFFPALRMFVIKVRGQEDTPRNRRDNRLLRPEGSQEALLGKETPPREGFLEKRTPDLWLERCGGARYGEEE